MAEPTLALQRFIRARLVASPAVLDLVPPGSIINASKQPDTVPAILIGEGHAFYGDLDDSFHDEAFALIHVWMKEKETTQAKLIAGAIRLALRDRPWPMPGYLCHRLRFDGGTFERKGEFSHAVLTVSAIMQERVAA